MSNSPSLVVAIAFTGVLIWVAAAPAKAASPIGREDCRILAPRYEPKPPRSPQAQPARWPGGARLSQPIAAPCPPSRPVDA
jgi:hypothetical protein